MKKYRLISLIALATLLVAGCEWDSSKYDAYVSDNHITVCPGSFVDEVRLDGVSACNMIKVGHIYCGPVMEDKIDLIVLDADEKNIVCVSHPGNSGQKDCDNEGKSLVEEKYPSEWEVCQNYRNQGLFNGITTNCECLESSNEACVKISELRQKMSPKEMFVAGDGTVTTYDHVSEKYKTALSKGICPSDYPVCHYDRISEKLGCIKLVKCGDEACNPLAQTCEYDENTDKSYCKNLDKCDGKCNSETQLCKLKDKTNDVWDCVNGTEEHCDNCTESQYCKKDRTTNQYKCVEIDTDKCNASCNEETQYCKKKTADNTYYCANIINDPCANIECPKDQYCAKTEDTWKCVSIELCTNKCETARSGCLTDELMDTDPQNCGGCSDTPESNVLYNCYNQYKHSDPRCNQRKCILGACHDGYYRDGNECKPYGADAEHCNENLNCNDRSHWSTGWSSVRCEINVNDFTKNQCVLDECKNGYHIYNNSCEEDSADNCGKHGSTCSPETIENSTDVICSEGRCLPIECQTGYHVYGRICEADTNENCGAHDKKCEKSSVAGIVAVSCDSGECKATACADTHIINNGLCWEKKCTQAKCQNIGSMGVFQSCNDGNWSEISLCSDGHSCNSEGTACGNCANETFKCENTGNMGSKFKCVDGSWTDEVACRDDSNNPLSCNADGNDCGVCENGRLKCDENHHSQSAMYICDNGAWTEDVACQNDSDALSCNTDGSDCGVCLNYAKKCIDDSNDGIGTEYNCSSGAWSVTSPCEDEYQHGISCGSNDRCGDCLNGSRQCSDSIPAQPQVCKNGTWVDDTPCLQPEHATAICLPGGICNFTCDGGYCKSDNKCTGSGDTECKLVSGSLTAGRQRTCESGIWSEWSDCANENSCKGNVCGACINDVKQCVTDDSYKRCSGGEWESAVSCENNMVCQQSNGECVTAFPSDCMDSGVVCHVDNCTTANCNESHQCVCTSCQADYHLTANHYCEPNTSSACGLPNQVNIVPCEHVTCDGCSLPFSINCTNEGKCGCPSGYELCKETVERSILYQCRQNCSSPWMPVYQSDI